MQKNVPVTTCKNCVLIGEVQSLKYLGLVLDNNLPWEPHAQSVKNYLHMASR
jgi:hypothetical protein